MASCTKVGKAKRLRPAIIAFFLLLAGSSARLGLAQAGSTSSPMASSEPEILSKAKAYCRLLQTASLDFVCREKITERTRQQQTKKASLNVDPLSFEVKDLQFEHELLYDYQYVRSGTLAKETRTLLEEDGRPRHDQNAGLMTLFFHYQNILFGPAAVLDDRNVSKYDFALTGEEASGKGEQAVIIDAIPNKTAEAEHLPFGKIWVSAGDGSIIKIEWDERTILGYSALEATAKELKAKPKLTMRTEFGWLKNGLRFPSRYTIVEAYEREKKPPFVRSELVVEYDHYQFFTVETQVEIKKR